jgi:uncharacterized protein DUF1566
MPNPASAGLPNSASYTNNVDGTVTDNVTGLVWEGTVDPSSYSQAAAAAYCANKGGAWRLPTRIELLSLVDFTVPPLDSTGRATRPSISETYFPNTPAKPFWTSTAYADDSSRAWVIDFWFTYGKMSVLAVTTTDRVRCVRPTAPRCYPARYKVEAEGSILDVATGLTWQQAVDAGSYTWSAAKTYCAGLGTGWRLPSVIELATIVDDTQKNPAIDGTAFPNTPATEFWTSSAYAAPDLYYAWTVQFFGGGEHVFSGAVGSPRVRCLR